MGTLSGTYPPRRSYGLLWAVLLAVLASARGSGAQVVVSNSASSSALLFPADVAFDLHGNLYFSDTNRQVVQRLDTTGAVTTVAGNGVQGFGGDGGLAVVSELDSPGGLAIDAAGNLYIADTHNHRVRRVDASTGKMATIAGTGVAGFAGDGASATAARLHLPTALAVDANGVLYIADTNNHRVRKVTPGTGVIATVAGNGLQGFIGDGGAASAGAIDSPGGLALDGAGNLYIADTHNQRLREVKAGTISTVAGTGTAGFAGDGASAKGALLALPHGVSVDGVGNVYVVDTNNQRVRRIAPDGTLLTVAGDGVQAFRGDGGQAVAASLNSPRGVAVSTAGLPTMADSANRRVRQVEADGTIVTLAGVGAVVPIAVGTLTLSAPATVVYGGGRVTATLTGGGQAGGTVTFYENGAAVLGVLPLTGGQAAFGTGGLSAGTHTIHAGYGGDANHAAATSAAVALPVLAAPVVASVPTVSLIYGQTVPALTGSLTGVLPRDAGAVSLQLNSAARSVSPAGSYPVTAAIAGSAAGNYALQPLIAAVTITKAGSVASLNESATTVTSGAPVTLAIHIASTTSGVPTGMVTLMDGAAILGTVPLSSTGDASYTATGLAAGTHSLVGVYAGDGDFLGSTTAMQTIAVANPPTVDFTIAATGAASQTVSAGSAANFNFAVQMAGGTLTGPISLAASGLPAGTTASFNPGTVVPGGTNAFELTVQTAQTIKSASLWGLGALFLLPLLAAVPRRRLAAALCLSGAMALVGCGANVMAVPAAAKSYPITVLGTATSASGVVLQRTATVTLTVQ